MVDDSSQCWSALHDRLHRTLRQRRLLLKHQQLLVAVSGGQDSLCLIRLLLDLQPKWGWKIAIAHCNHRWREDSTANANYVQHLAETWQVLYYQAIAEIPPRSEATAREWRYCALADIALKQGYTTVVTGHTLSDRAETLLYNLIRGSGSDGLQALTWQRELVAGVQLVRPLLNFSRKETATFCRDANLTIWEDTTNQNWHYARNRIRQELLPYLQTHFNPQVEQALAQTAELLQAEVDYLQTEAQRLYTQAVVADLADFRLSRPILKSAPLALQRRVMRQILIAVLPTTPTFEHIEKLTALITAPNRSQTDPFPGGAIAKVEGDWIVLQTVESA
jgi:tRNA(Ile)-lysidine synthase